MITRLGLVTPVLDDWESLAILLRAIDARFAGTGRRFDVVVIDDGSRAACDPASLALAEHGCIGALEVVRLEVNLGHQRAIAVGLTEIARRADIEAVVVMDSDGEDRPEDIDRLLAAAELDAGQVVMARRAKRLEPLGFRIAYLAYRLLFRALTGRPISFGNFSLLPAQAVRRLVHTPELWNNLAASIMRSRLPYVTVPTQRGRRYAGRSRMNLAGLVAHGLSAMSVYADLVFVRILVGAGILAGLTLVGMAVVLVVRLATDFAIPGWASAVLGNLMVMLLQTGVIVVAAVLMQLAGRSNRPVIPAVDARVFIAEVTTGSARSPAALPDFE